MVTNSFARPFAEQVDFLRKKTNLPSKRWDDIKKAEHDHGFIVAGATKADLINDLRNAVDKCISEGKSLGWFQKNFDEIVKKNGWTGWTGEGSTAGRDWRTTIIYQTNMSQSYNAARWAQLHDPDLIKSMPYLTYHHADGVRHPRPQHLSWDGFTAPRDHPFWATHAPANGWRCHCYLSAASESDFAKSKADGKHEPPAGWDKIDPKTGDPVGIDKGFGYAPGASAHKSLRDFVEQKRVNLHPDVARALAAEVKPVLGVVGITKQLTPHWDAATKAGKWHNTSFSDAPSYIKESVRRVGDPKSILETPKAHPYCKWRSVIEMDGLKGDGVKSQSTWRHEYGHFVDSMLSDNLPGAYWVSHRAAFSGALKNDAATLIKDGAHGLKSAKATIARRADLDNSYELSRVSFMGASDKEEWLSARAQAVGLNYADVKISMQKHAVFPELLPDSVARQDRYRRIIEAYAQKDAQALMDAMTGGRSSNEYVDTFNKGVLGEVSDLFGSVTRNKVSGFNFSGSGHSDAYYRKNSGAQEAESFANLYCIHGEGGVFFRQLAAQFTPGLNRVFLELLK